MSFASSIRYAAALSLSAPALAAPNSPVSIFGVVLGRNLNLPPCVMHMFSGEPTDIVEEVQPQFCAAKPIQLSDAPFQRADLIFSEEQKPDIVSVNLVSAYIWQGNVEAIEFATPSHNFSDTVMFGLTAKFGKPQYARIGRSIVEGIALPSFEAHWAFPGVTVDYKAIDDMDNGVVKIKTTKYDQIEDDAALKASAKKVAL